MPSAMRAILAGFCFAILAATSGAAQQDVPVPRIAFEKFRLPNGLEVILVEDKRLPLVAVNLWYHVGPAQEKPGQTGFAHLFEHMMFQGSKHAPEDAHLQMLEGAGATDLNGTTDFDRTNYFETVPSNQLELALWLESDRMGFLLETLDQAKLSNQQDVVRNERRQSVENRPYGLVDEGLYHTLFPKGHPYYASVIGSHADIESIKLGDVTEFFKRYYSPGNASLAIVGDYDKSRIKALVTKYFGPIPAGPKVEPVKVTTPPITSERRLVVTDKVELPRVILAWLTPPIYQPGDAEADLVGQILGGGKSSRLYQKLVYEQQIAQDVSASQYSLMLGSVFSIEVTARPGVKPEQLEQAVDAELLRLRESGPTAEELERARNTILSSLVRGLERLGGFGGVADLLNRYNHYLGDPGYLPKDIARYRAQTPATLKAFAEKTFHKNNRAVVYGVPGEKKIEDVPAGPRATATATAAAAAPGPAVPGQEWRATPPGPGPSSALMLPKPQQFKLDNGLTVYVLPQRQLPVVSANLIVLAGSDRNPLEMPGLASFTADMLDEGTKTRKPLDIARDLASLGATLSAGSTTDYSAVSLRSLTHTADAAFGLLADVVLNPAFPAEEVERVRASRLTQLVQQRENPTAIAQRVFNDALYGPGHPYGYTELGTQKSVQAIGPAQLRSFWSTGYTPGNSALVIAGDVDVAGARALAQKHFGAWQGAATTGRAVDVTQATAGKLLIVDRGTAPQTALRIGMVGVPRSSPDYVPITIMNNALGGLFASRINLNLREKNGYTYGASSGFGFRRGPGPFVVGTNVRSDVTGPAVKEIYSELRRIRAEPVTPAELTLARDALTRSLPGLFETTSDAASTASQLFVYGLGLDYFNTLPARVDAVTAADVQRVASQYVVPEKLVVVAVGDKAAIEPQLRELDLGPVEQRQAE
jgi:zinc protease